ncbi:MAG: hypothetical protein IKP73_03850 [Bacteroidales bacterium]|nr:hypothetical protein [Bacteroidales bacterium]
MDTIDFDNSIIIFNGKTFPFKVIIEVTEKGEEEHIISVVDLQSELLDGNNDYVSDDARWIDEQITYFVENEDSLNRSDKDILKDIYG